MLEILGTLSKEQLKYAPKYLDYRGDLTLLKMPSVSIVGSRDCSAQADQAAKKITDYCINQNVCIVSGLAKGIDTTAHKSAIYGLGKTIAVIPTPISDCYPKENVSLKEIISEQHLVLSQFPENKKVLKHNFIARNRLMALISDSTVIVEAKENSGSFHQAWEAIRLNKPLFFWHETYKMPYIEQFKKYGALQLSPDNLADLNETFIDKAHLDQINL